MADESRLVNEETETPRQRIQTLRELGQIRPEVAEFAGEALGLAEDGLPVKVTGEAGVLFVTHLCLALERSLQGESIGVDPAPLEEELKGREEAIDLAGRIAGRVKERLGVELPRSELLFMALHLAALAGADPQPQEDQPE